MNTCVAFSYYNSVEVNVAIYLTLIAIIISHVGYIWSRKGVTGISGKLNSIGWLLQNDESVYDMADKEMEKTLIK